MKDFFKFMFAGMFGSILAGIVGIIVGIIAIFAIIGMIASGGDDFELKENSVLHLKFNEAIGDRSSATPNLMSVSLDTKQGLTDIIKNIKKAKEDENITGIFLDLGVLSAGYATVEEIRNALIDFKADGKFIMSHADYYTHKSYYLASVADKLYLTPEGEVQFVGLSAQIMFYKSILKKIGVDPEIIRHGKFKSAVEPFMLDSMSTANREQTMTYVNSFWGTIVKGVSKQRNISVADLNQYADSISIRSAKTALDLNIVDALKYKDQILADLQTLSGTEEKEAILVPLNKYATNAEKIEDIEFPDDKIAVIYASGEIGMGTGDAESIGSESLSKAIREARKDSSIKAIVLRVNSPGGSALASEIIWRETVLAKETKPFIVSMGDMAASGGYYIACYADTIVAQPNTLTGSIGVFGLLFNAVPVMNEYGVYVSTVNSNAHSDIATPLKKMTPYERGVIQTGVEEIYGTFIKHVAEGRGMTVDEVDAIGQGRVWTGENAMEIGLVDVFGGLNDAIRIASEKANITEYQLESYPKKEKFQQMIENVVADTKTNIIKSELGFTYKYYKNLKTVSKMKGIQARTPYFIDFE